MFGKTRTIEDACLLSASISAADVSAEVVSKSCCPSAMKPSTKESLDDAKPQEEIRRRFRSTN